MIFSIRFSKLRRIFIVCFSSEEIKYFSPMSTQGKDFVYEFCVLWIRHKIHARNFCLVYSWVKNTLRFFGFFNFSYWKWVHVDLIFWELLRCWEIWNITKKNECFFRKYFSPLCLACFSGVWIWWKQISYKKQCNFQCI